MYLFYLATETLQLPVSSLLILQWCNMQYGKVLNRFFSQLCSPYVPCTYYGLVNAKGDTVYHKHMV